MPTPNVVWCSILYMMRTAAKMLRTAPQRLPRATPNAYVLPPSKDHTVIVRLHLPWKNILTTSPGHRYGWHIECLSFFIQFFEHYEWRKTPIIHFPRAIPEQQIELGWHSLMTDWAVLTGSVVIAFCWQWNAYGNFWSGACLARAPRLNIP